MTRDWMPSAVCRHHDPEIWFPTLPGRNGAAQAARAEAICRTCPVIAECAAYQKATHSSWGVWGGNVIRESRTYRPGVFATPRRPV